MTINRADKVSQQYATADKLNIRIAFQRKYSCNQQGFGPWICGQYALRPGMHLLEVGCGTGSMWVDQPLPQDCTLLLTDFSPTMVQTARQNLSGRPEITFQQMDVQALPCPDHSFDAVIANMMLYHVPDLPRALREIRRVLKAGGTFFCATYGEHGAVETVAEWLRLPLESRYPFSLQNGAEQLRHHFAQVEQRLYPDAFRITSAEDLADYLLSLTSMSALADVPRDVLCSQLAQHMEDGVIHLPKEYGLFICR